MALLNVSDLIVHLQALRRNLVASGKRAGGTGAAVSLLGNIPAEHHQQLSKVINAHLGDRWLVDMSLPEQMAEIDAVIAELRG